MAAPSAARASAVARPTPLPAPVTSATCPASRVIHYPPALTVALVRPHFWPIDVPAQDTAADDRSGRKLYPQSTAPPTAVMAQTIGPVSAKPTPGWSRAPHSPPG